MATVHRRMLATVVAQLGPPALGNAWVRIELIGALLPFGVLQLRGVKALDHDQRRLAGLRVQHRKVVGAQGQGFIVADTVAMLSGFAAGNRSAQPSNDACFCLLE